MAFKATLLISVISVIGLNCQSVSAGTFLKQFKNGPQIESAMKNCAAKFHIDLDELMKLEKPPKFEEDKVQQ